MHRPLDEEPPHLQELRRRVSENMRRIAAGEYRREPKPKKKRELETAEAWEIQLGDVVLEYRTLLKLELKLARKDSRGKLDKDERAYWEEVDARLDTLREELKDYTKEELTRFVRLYRKSLKKGSTNVRRARSR